MLKNGVQIGKAWPCYGYNPRTTTIPPPKNRKAKAKKKRKKKCVVVLEDYMIKKQIFFGDLMDGLRACS